MEFNSATSRAEASEGWRFLPNRLSNRHRVSVGLLEWREVNSVVHLESIWEPMSLNVFIDLEEQVDSTLVRAVEGTKLFHLVNTTESSRQLREDFPWSYRNQKCKCLVR